MLKLSNQPPPLSQMRNSTVLVRDQLLLAVDAVLLVVAAVETVVVAVETVVVAVVPVMDSAEETAVVVAVEDQELPSLLVPRVRKPSLRERDQRPVERRDSTNTPARLVKKLTHSTESPVLDVERETSKKVATERATGEMTKNQIVLK